MSAKRKKQPIETTSELREIVEQVVLCTKPENPKEAVKKDMSASISGAEN